MSMIYCPECAKPIDTDYYEIDCNNNEHKEL